MADYKQVMINKSDSELLEIITKLKDDYQKEAVHAAEAEIKSRNLSSEQVEKVESELKEKEVDKLNKERQPLGVGQKILFLLFFWGVIPWAMAGTYKNTGYLKKYKDAWLFMKIGFAVSFGIPILLILIIKMFA